MAGRPPDDTRGPALFGAGLLALGGLLYAPAGFFFAVTLGAGNTLDPTWWWPVSYAGGAFGTLLFTGGGLIAAIVHVAAAALVVARHAAAPYVLVFTGLLGLCTANLPLAVLAFGLAYLVATAPAPAPAAPSPPPPGVAGGSSPGAPSATSPA